MDNKWVRYLLISPIIILIIMLYFINYTINYFREITYSYAFDTNVGSVQMLAKELDERLFQGYLREEDIQFNHDMILVFNNAIGKKDAVITFLVDQNYIIYHSNYDNKKYLSSLTLEELDSVIKSNRAQSGLVTFPGFREDQQWYYYTISDGVRSYRLFMSVDRDELEGVFGTDKIVIPISVIGFLLIVAVEDSIWNRAIGRVGKKAK